MATSTSPDPNFRRRLWILVVVLALMIAGLTAILILWPRNSGRSSTSRAEMAAEEIQSSLPEALQPAEESAIDNSDILASAPATPAAETAAADSAQPTKKLTLMVRNHNSTVDPVDIKVTLDGRVIIDENFKYGSTIKVGGGVEVPAPGLDWKQLPLKLAVGQHQVKAVSARGDAVLETDFTTTDKDGWASLEYVDGKKFDWQLSELPIISL